MRIFLFALLISCVCSFNLAAQPTVQWNYFYGGSGDDRAYSIQQVSDSGYIVAGYTASNDLMVSGNHGGLDYWVIKLDLTGFPEWQKCLGGSGDDEATSIQSTRDGGYIVAGYSNSNDSNVTGNHGGYDYWVVKLNSVGEIQWQKALGGTGDDFAYSVQQTNDSGYIVAGSSTSSDADVTVNHGFPDYWVVKLNSSGNIQWQKSLGGMLDDEAFSIQQTIDGGYIVAGYTTSINGDVTGNHGGNDFWIVKLSDTGVLQWQKCYGGTSADEAFSIQQTRDSGYVVAGLSTSNNGNVTGHHGNYDFWIVKINSVGTLQWQKSLGGTLNDFASSIKQTTDGGYIVAGYSDSNNGDLSYNLGLDDYWVVKIDSVGSIQWQESLGSFGNDLAYSIQQTSDEGYVVAGYSDTGVGYDFWILKYSPYVGIEEINPKISNLRVMPNPVSQSANISFSLLQPEDVSIKIYDVTGRVIQNLLQEKLDAGNHLVRWDANDDRAIEKGIYLLNISGQSFSQSSKLVVVK